MRHEMVRVERRKSMSVSVAALYKKRKGRLAIRASVLDWTETDSQQVVVSLPISSIKGPFPSNHSANVQYPKEPQQNHP